MNGGYKMTDLKNDFYETINGEWLKSAEIPSDKPATGGFQDLVEDIDRILMKELAEMNADTSKIPNQELKEALVFYDLAQDYDQRNKLQAEPIRDLLNEIQAVESYADFNHSLADWVKAGMALPFSIFVDADMKNTKKHAVYLNPTSLILPDKTYYKADNPQAEKLLQVIFDMAVKLLQISGFSQVERESLTEHALAFDYSLVKYVRSDEENADYTKIYNPRDRKSVKNYSDKIDFDALLENIFTAQVSQVIVTEPAYFENMKQFITQGHLPLLNSWMIVRTLVGYACYLSEDFRQTGSLYSRALSGAETTASQEKAAYYLTLGIFDQVIGLYYGKKYFGEKA